LLILDTNIVSELMRDRHFDDLSITLIDPWTA
jgi:hypothetical protein